jgi:hypothetical protein
MAHDTKSWKEFNELDEKTIRLSAMYSAIEYKLIPKGSNYTPPKKKRKKK